MKNFLILYFAFFSLYLSSQPITINVEKSSISGLSSLHRNLLISATIANTASNIALDFMEQSTSIQGQIITRSIPVINGIEVEGADGIYIKDQNRERFSYTHFFIPSSRFMISGVEALEQALIAQQNSTIKNPYVEKINGSFVPLWLMHFGKLRPVFKTRLPTLSVVDLKDIYIDAETKEILKIEASANFDQAPAEVFIYSPGPGQLTTKGLKTVKLNNLLKVQENGSLNGEYVQVRSCCQYYSCPKDGPCTDDNKRCARSSHEGAQQSRELVQLPTDSLGLDPLMTLPSTINVNTVRCTYLPFAKASLKSANNNMLGFYDTPIDEPGLESEMDRFSEIQAYFSISSFFNHIRSLLNDNTWCLRESAMSCDKNGKPILADNGLAKNPYRVFVNQLVPDMKIDNANQSDPENFIVQILAGKGSSDKPLVLNSFSRMGNAAFVPALSQLKATTPRADEILSDLIKPYDHNVFFQGDRDFAYDGDVVFHEFMHAVTTSMVNKLNSLGLNQWGIHSEPGSLNEAWSDYFAAAFTGDSAIGEYAAIKGAYGEASLRDIDSQASCPENVIGEVHNDAKVWSGGLWELRQQIQQQYGDSIAIDFDRAVLAALAQASISEDFKTASDKLLNTIRERPELGSKIADMADTVLSKRGLKDCFRAFSLSSVNNLNQLSQHPKDMLFVASKTQIGLKNYAPASSQLKIAIPAGTRAIDLSWRQFLGGTGALLGTETTPANTSNIIPLGVIMSFDEPIEWRFKNATAMPYKNGQELGEQPGSAEYRNGFWHTSKKIELGRCEQRVLYVSLLSKDFKYVLENINVAFDIDKNQDRSNCDFNVVSDDAQADKQSSCSSTKSSSWWILGAFVVYFWLRKYQHFLSSYLD